ncbi:MAG: hypothetical protein AAF228_01675 [Pseudomonadota bacterium]
MTKPIKFLFNDNFDDRVVEPEPEDIEMKIEEKLQADFSVKLEDEKQKAYQNGFQEGQEKARESLEAEINKALQNIISNSEKMTNQFDEKIKDFRTQTINLGVSIAEKLAGELIKREPTNALESFFVETLSFIQTEPKILISVPEELTTETEQRLTRVAEQHNYKGNISILGQADMPHGDWCFEWSQGGVSKDQEKIKQAVTQSIENYLALNENDKKALMPPENEEPSIEEDNNIEPKKSSEPEQKREQERKDPSEPQQKQNPDETGYNRQDEEQEDEILNEFAQERGETDGDYDINDQSNAPSYMQIENLISEDDDD